jgi:hypothetical protein
MHTNYPTPPTETGSIHHDGMSAIRWTIEHMHSGACELSLSRAQLIAACHVAPIATTRRPDEDPQTLATITQAISRCASALRLKTRLDAEAAATRPQDAPGVERSDDRPNDGPMARLQPQPRPQPPAAPAMRPPTPIRETVIAF